MNKELLDSLDNCQVARGPLKSIDLMNWPRALKVLTCVSGGISKTKVELEELAKERDSEGILETKV